MSWPRQGPSRERALQTAHVRGIPEQQPWATAVLAELLVHRVAVAEARALLDGLRPR